MSNLKKGAAIGLFGPSIVVLAFALMSEPALAQGSVVQAGSVVVAGVANPDTITATTPDSTGEDIDKPKDGDIVVEGKRVAGADAAKAALEQMPGTASVVSNADLGGRAANAEDVLRYVPGVFAAATSGNSANKISIRGSGLNTFYGGYSLGIRYYYDGLPITGPGGTQEDLLNASAVNYTEILNGANAFSYGAVSLGGAINFVTNTGRSSPGLWVEAEFGSYGYKHFQGSYGGTIGSDTDYYVYADHSARIGFQRYTPNSWEDYVLNVGHRFNSHLETRFVLRHHRENLLQGSTLTLAQLQADPTQSVSVYGRRKPGTTLLSNKTTYTFDDASKIDFGIDWNDFPLANGWKSATPADWRSQDLSLSLRYTRTGDTILGLKNDLSLVYNDTRSILGDVRGYNVVGGTVDANGATVGGTRQLVQYTRYTGSHDTAWGINDTLHLAPKLQLLTAVSLLEISRQEDILYTTRVNLTAFGPSVHYDKYYWAPRAGLLYQPTSTIDLFGNVTRSIDPPVTWQIGSTGVAYLRPITPQKGWTTEIGGRFHSADLDASLTLYRTAIEDELLSILPNPVIPGVANAINTNASPTIHQGIEAGLNWKVWRDAEGNDVVWHNAYTHNDFHYRHDSVFGQNQLPGLPRHAYQSELKFEQKDGLYFGANLRFTSKYFVDYANTFQVPSYAIWGANVGYAAKKGWKVYADLKNLGDKHYVAATGQAYNLAGIDSNYFYPGDGFSVYGGISFRL